MLSNVPRQIIAVKHSSPVYGARGAAYPRQAAGDVPQINRNVMQHHLFFMDLELSNYISAACYLQV
jgi:hypothetical protein